MMGNPASNTRECFSEFIGQRVIGVLFNALPLGRKDIASGGKTLVFEDGRGLTIAANGTFWVESAADVKRAVQWRQDELNTTRREIADVLKLAGALAEA